MVGVFDIVGTIASGYLTDRFNPRVLLAVYYSLRGVGLVMLPGMLSDTLHPSMIGFVIVYGLDWVATVPPTVALCREAFGDGRHHRLRLGLRLAPDRCGDRLGGRRSAPGRDRQLHHRLVRRGRAVRGGGGRLHRHPSWDGVEAGGPEIDSRDATEWVIPVRLRHPSERSVLGAGCWGILCALGDRSAECDTAPVRMALDAPPRLGIDNVSGIAADDHSGAERPAWMPLLHLHASPPV